VTEYIDIRAEPTDDPDIMCLIANVDLSLEDDPEVYLTPEEGEEGSPVAQTLFMLPGLAALTIDGREMLLTRMAGVEWYDLIEDVRDALRDFFL
jgi:hypothetical protein